MKYYITVIIILVNFATIFAGNNNNKVADWMENYSSGFIENKGQLKATDGNTVDNVFFKLTNANIDVYITNTGLTYAFKEFSEMEDTNKDFNLLANKGLDEYLSELEIPSMQVRYHRVDMVLDNANINIHNIENLEVSKQGFFNYYLGHCPEGILNVKEYHKIKVKDIYPGIDWIIYTYPGKGIKYDFIVAPDVSPALIKFHFEGANKIQTNGVNIDIETSLGNIKDNNLFVYQKGGLVEIEAKYQMDDENNISINVDDYDKEQALIIDPILSWSTLFGGNGGDRSREIKIDEQDNLFVTGYTSSSDFPIINNGTVYTQAYPATTTSFVMKFNSIGQLMWSTYYGGNSTTTSNGIALDKLDNLFFVGNARTINTSPFPTFNPGGGAYYYATTTGSWANMSFIVKLNRTTGTREWATLIGNAFGAASSSASGVEVDGNNDVYMIGGAGFSFIPILTLPGAYNQATIIPGFQSDAYIEKFSNNGNHIWGTVLGGSLGEAAYDIIADKLDNIYVTGYTVSPDFPLYLNPGGGAYFDSSLNSSVQDLFISKFDKNGVPLWSTLYSGSQTNVPNSMAIDSSNNLYLLGHTRSSNFTQPNDFPVLNPGGCAYFQGTYNDIPNPNLGDAFISKFSDSGVQLWSTYFGGTGKDRGVSIIIGKDQEIYIYGSTRLFSASNFPIKNLTGSSFYSASPGGIDEEMFFAMFSSNYQLKWSTYFGGNAKELAGNTFGSHLLATNSSGDLFAGGYTASTNFPLLASPGAYNQDTIGKGTLVKFNYTPIILDTSTTNLLINCQDSVLYKGIYYSQTGEYLDTITCDSVFIIDVQNSGAGPQLTQLINSQICSGDSAIFAGIFYSTAGIYYDTLIGVNTCDSIIEWSLSVSYAGITLLELNICDGDTLMLNGEIITEPNTYFDTLSTTLGCDSIINILISNATVCDSEEVKPVIYIPTSFSPNGDGKNDVFRIRGEGIQGLVMKIFDRWGNNVFESDNPSFVWNGLNNTKGFANAGVYVYVLTGNFIDGNEINLKGNVTLVR